MQKPHLLRKLEFLREIDRLKAVLRQSSLLDKSRKENSAEHSWHLAMYALVLTEYAAGHIDAFRVMRMLLLHDIVEIDAGDFPIHGAPNPDQAAQEQAAAQRIYGLLPPPMGQELKALWEEFESAETADAKFAKALDRFQPLLTNIVSGGGTWTESHVTREDVVNRYGPAIRDGAPELWAIAEGWVAEHFAQSKSAE